MNNRKIVVTGAAGFIGYHFSKSLLVDGNVVLGIDNMNDYYDPDLKHARLDELQSYQNISFKKVDIADREGLKISCTSLQPEKIVHLACSGRCSIQH